MSAWERPAVWMAGLAYLVLVAWIGYVSASRTRSSRDFFIAGQRVGLWVTALAAMSASFSGFLFLGGPGLTYRIGLGSMLIVLPVGFTSGLLCWVVARRLRQMAGRQEIFTLPDVLQQRYQSRAVAGLGAAAVLGGTVAYLGLQFRVLGVLAQSVFGVDSLLLGMLLGMLVVVAYSAAGGMVAGVYTDLLQGALMLVTAVVVFTFAVGRSGGWMTMLDSIRDAPQFGEAFLDPLGRAPLFTVFGFFFVFGIGVLGQPQMLHKFFMIDDPRKLRWMPLILGSSQAVCLLVWLGVGLAVPALVAQGRMAPPASADQAMPAFLLQQAPEWLAGLVFAGILAAVMSTADSFLNLGSAALVRDLPRALGREPKESRRELLHGRVAVLGISVLSVIFAGAHGDLIALVGTFAFGTFAAALMPALAIGLCWDRVSPRAAGASVATGMLLNLGLELAAKQSFVSWIPAPPLPPGVLPSAVSLAASSTVLLLVTWLAPGPVREGGVHAV